VSKTNQCEHYTKQHPNGILGFLVFFEKLMH